MNAIEAREVHKLYRRYGRRKHFGTLKSALLTGSLGLAYGYVTEALGFRMNRHEGKLTGLAAYGEPDVPERWRDTGLRVTGPIASERPHCET